MNKIIIILTSIALFFSVFVEARRHANNPYVVCERFVNKMSSPWPGFIAKARDECLSMDFPQGFNPAAFARANAKEPQQAPVQASQDGIEDKPNLVCEGKVNNMTVMWPGFIEQARKACLELKNPEDFDPAAFTRNNLNEPGGLANNEGPDTPDETCETKVSTMTPMYPGFIEDARKACLKLKRPSDFDRASFTRSHLTAPKKSSESSD